MLRTSPRPIDRMPCVALATPVGWVATWHLLAEFYFRNRLPFRNAPPKLRSYVGGRPPATRPSHAILVDTPLMRDVACARAQHLPEKVEQLMQSRQIHPQRAVGMVLPIGRLVFTFGLHSGRVLTTWKMRAVRCRRPPRMTCCRCHETSTAERAAPVAVSGCVSWFEDLHKYSRPIRSV